MGSIFKTIFEPSSGQIGKRLNTPRNRLRLINWIKTVYIKKGVLMFFSIKARRIDKIKLLSGPARATNISSFLGFLKL